MEPSLSYCIIVWPMIKRLILKFSLCSSSGVRKQQIQIKRDITMSDSFQKLLIHLGPFLVETLSISRIFQYIVPYSPNILERRIENQEGNDALMEFFTFLLR